MPSVEEARAWYRADDPVHGFDHVLRVLRLAEKLAKEEGADMEVVRAAALLHDARGGDATEEGRADHQHRSAEFAAQVLAAEGWDPERISAVQHCIRAHRFRGDESPETLEAKVLFDADKLDVMGAFGVARTLAYAVEAGQPLYAEPSEQFLRTGEKEPGEPHSAYHEYLFKLRTIQDLLHTPSAKRLGRERHTILVEFFERLRAEAQGPD